MATQPREVSRPVARPTLLVSKLVSRGQRRQTRVAVPPSHTPWFARISPLSSIKSSPSKSPDGTATGPVVRFAPNSLSFNTAEAFDAIYKSPKTSVVKSDWYQCVRDSAGGFESTFTARQTARHAAKRRLLSQAFSERALRDYEPRICAHIEAWIEAIQDEISDGNNDGNNDGDGGLVDIDLGQWSNYLIFDILGDLGYGSSFGLVTTATNRSIVDLIPKATGGWYSLGYHPFTKLLRRILFQTPLGAYLGGPSYHHNIQFRTFCLSKLKERRQRDAAEEAEEAAAAPRVMFTHLLHGRDPETGEGYSTGDLACESVLLMVAGSQSTAGGLAAVFFYLAHHPAKLARLRAEIHGAFAREQDIRYEYASCALATLPYLRACVNESLRLSPPTPGHLPRDVVGLETGAVAMIDGHAVPGGTTVGVSPYALHRNASYFRDPLGFVPERWLAPRDGDGDGRGGPMVMAMGMVGFAAFSGGPTGCIGQQLAMVEMSLAAARLLWRFDLRLLRRRRRRRHSDSSSPVEFVAKDRFVAQAEGPRVRLVVSCPARRGEAD
ncbi:hypothetical protein EsDP_00006227 [Epichloe bromicola]|uniref:Benzoate 4-monooxygenase cytochrome P450 n=1 Tax=Epichloe bromicola TaxID=79588 RepID=A0ABQ0CXE5_9HYPO